LIGVFPTQRHSVRRSLRGNAHETRTNLPSTGSSPPTTLASNSASYIQQIRIEGPLAASEERPAPDVGVSYPLVEQTATALSVEVISTLSHLSEGHVLAHVGDFDCDVLALVGVGEDHDGPPLDAGNPITLFADVLDFYVSLFTFLHGWLWWVTIVLRAGIGSDGRKSE